MKKLLIVLYAFCLGAINNSFADTASIKWYNADLYSYETTACTLGNDIILPAAPTKPGYTFIGWQELSCQPLQYIQSTGTQYIDTGWYLPANKDNFVLSITFEAMSGNAVYASICGVNNSNNSGAKQYYLFQFNNDVTKISAVNGDLAKGAGQFNIANGEQTATMSYDNGITTVTYNGATKVTENTMAERGTTPLWLFKSNIYGSSANLTTGYSKIRLYAFSISVDNTYVLNLIPCRRNSDSVVGMYDIVSGAFFTNSGTGDFIAGPVVQ